MPNFREIIRKLFRRKKPLGWYLNEVISVACRRPPSPQQELISRGNQILASANLEPTVSKIADDQGNVIYEANK